jgi:hypothetical protein
LTPTGPAAAFFVYSAAVVDAVAVPVLLVAAVVVAFSKVDDELSLTDALVLLSLTLTLLVLLESFAEDVRLDVTEWEVVERELEETIVCLVGELIC